MATRLADQLAAEGLVAAALRVSLPAITHPATFLDAVWVAVRPVHESAEIIPLVHAAHVDPITHANRHAFSEVNVMRDQQGPAIADVDDETLVARAVVVIRQKAADEARDFDPPPIVAFGETDLLARRDRYHCDFDATVRLAACRGTVIGNRARLAHADRDQAL